MVVKKRNGFHERTIRELEMGQGGLIIGEPLEAFQGILAGMPTYVGDADKLLERT